MMASYFHYVQAVAQSQQHNNNNNHHGGGRNRRAPRLSVSHNQRQLRGTRPSKDINESATLLAFRVKFEAVRSFELEDDVEFCPNLLSDNELLSVSSASERSSLASNSPESSPTQQPQTVAPVFSLNSTSPAFIPPSYQSPHSSLKLHQPSATRGRNAIPIINPATGITMASPSPSASPSAMQQLNGRRW